MRSKQERTCEHCRKEFWAYTHNVVRGWGRFCSRACTYAGIKARPKKGLKTTTRQLQPGDPVPAGEPKRYKNAAGYVRLRWLVGPRTFVEVYEHRLVAGLPAGVVHHKNERKDDNSPTNLAPLTSSEHAQIHHPTLFNVDLAACMYMEGWTLPQLSTYFGKNTGNLNRSLRKYGVTMRTGSESKRLMAERGKIPTWGAHEASGARA